MAPLLYGSADQQQSRSKKSTLQGHGHHPAHLSSQHRQKFPPGQDHHPAGGPGGLYIESFALQQQPHPGNRKVPLPLATHELLPTIATSASNAIGSNGQQQQAKENVAQNHLYGAGVNAKDVYMSELDGLRKDRRNGGYYVPNELQLESRFARNLEANFATRATILERSSGRKLRARSESEPQEFMYHSAHRNGAGFSAGGGGGSSLLAGQRTAGHHHHHHLHHLRHSRDVSVRKRQAKRVL